MATVPKDIVAAHSGRRFAASLWDWLPFMLPGRVAGVAGSVPGRGRYGDAFVMGGFATMLAASCSAPISSAR